VNRNTSQGQVHFLPRSSCLLLHDSKPCFPQILPLLLVLFDGIWCLGRAMAQAVRRRHAIAETRWPGFYPGSVQVGFAADEVGVWKVFSWFLLFSCHCNSPGASYSCVIWGLKNRPVGDRSSETQSHRMDNYDQTLPASADTGVSRECLASKERFKTDRENTWNPRIAESPVMLACVKERTSWRRNTWIFIFWAWVTCSGFPVKTTERRRRMVSIPVSHSGRPGLRSAWFSSVLSYLTLGHDHFLPNSLRCTQVWADSVLKRTVNK
jgi:hypothetical protein